MQNLFYTKKQPDIQNMIKTVILCDKNSDFMW